MNEEERRRVVSSTCSGCPRPRVVRVARPPTEHARPWLPLRSERADVEKWENPLSRAQPGAGARRREIQFTVGMLPRASRRRPTEWSARSSGGLRARSRLRAPASRPRERMTELPARIELRSGAARRSGAVPAAGRHRARCARRSICKTKAGHLHGNVPADRRAALDRARTRQHLFCLPPAPRREHVVRHRRPRRDPCARPIARGAQGWVRGRRPRRPRAAAGERPRTAHRPSRSRPKRSRCSISCRPARRTRARPRRHRAPASVLEELAADETQRLAGGLHPAACRDRRIASGLACLPARVRARSRSSAHPAHRQDHVDPAVDRRSPGRGRLPDPQEPDTLRARAAAHRQAADRGHVAPRRAGRAPPRASSTRRARSATSRGSRTSTRSAASVNRARGERSFADLLRRPGAPRRPRRSSPI